MTNSLLCSMKSVFLVHILLYLEIESKLRNSLCVPGDSLCSEGSCGYLWVSCVR